MAGYMAWTWDATDKKYREEAEGTVEHLQKEGERASKRLDLRLAALADKRWATSAVAPKLRARAEQEYADTVAGLQSQLIALVEVWGEALVDMRKDRVKLSGEWQRKAFVDVPQAAIETFRMKLASMASSDLVATYRDGADWQRATIAAYWQLPKPAGGGVLSTDVAASELAELIATGPTELKGKSVLGGDTVRPIPSEGAISEFNGYVRHLLDQSKTIDRRAYMAELTGRFGIEGTPNPFDAATIEGESLRILREYDPDGSAESDAASGPPSSSDAAPGFLSAYRDKKY